MRQRVIRQTAAKIAREVWLLWAQLVILFFSASSVGRAADPIAVRWVTETGQAAPGSSLAFEAFDFPAVDGVGNAIASAVLANSMQQQQGIWAERTGGTLVKIVATGDPHPPTQSPYYFGQSFDANPTISDSGRIGFLSPFVDANGVGGIGSGAWLASPLGEVSLLATSTNVPGATASVAANPISLADVNDAGQTVLRSLRNRIFVTSPLSGLRLVARTEAPAPGLPGSTMTDLDLPKLNKLGQLSWLGRAQISTGNIRAVWKESSPGNGAPVAKEGETAPGLGGAPFFFFSSQNIDDQGRIAFAAQALTTNLTADSGVWAERDGEGLQPLLLEGDLAPGTGADVRFANLDRISLLAAYGPLGQVAVKSGLVGPGVDSTNDSGIWLAENDGSLRLIAREGQPAPGTEIGVTFDFLNSSAEFFVNARGQVAFFAALKGSGIDAGNDRGVWAESVDGTLTLLARTGAMYQDQTGATFQLETLGIGPGAFGANGHLAFLARYAPNGRTGVFVSDAVAVPEPPAKYVGAMLVSSSFRRRRVIRST